MPNDAEHRLNDEIAGLRSQLARLQQHRYLRAHETIGGMIWYNLVRGLALGLGTAIGATLLVSSVAFALSQIDFIPIVGEWALQLAKVIEAGRGAAE